MRRPGPTRGTDVADIVDTANDHAELLLRMSVAQQQRRARLLPRGTCLCCDAPVLPAVMFCDADCREDWEREQAARARNGRPAE